jgi:hypothetical protein
MSVLPNPVWSSALPSSVTISYNVQNATGVSITDDNASYSPSYTPAVTTGGTSASASPVPSVTTTYSMTATGFGVPYTCSTTLTVNSGFPPAVGCISVGVNNPSCSTPVARTGSVRKGNTATLYWNVSGVGASGCSVSQNGAPWLSGQNATNATGVATPAITQRTQFGLSCAALDGTTFSDTAVVNVLPEFQEI